MKRDTGQAGLLGLDAIGPDAIGLISRPEVTPRNLNDSSVWTRQSWCVAGTSIPRAPRGTEQTFGSAARSSRLSVLTETGCGLVAILLGPTANTDVVSKEDAFGECALGQWQGRCACGACKRMALGGWQR